MGELSQKGLGPTGVYEEEIGEILGVSFRGVSGDPNDWLTEEDIVSIMSDMNATVDSEWLG
jgi:hypothetical protein